MPSRDPSPSGTQANAATALAAAAGAAVVILPWAGLVVPLLLAPLRVLSRRSVLIWVAFVLLAISGVVTGGLDTGFMPLFAIGAVALGAGSAIPVLVGEQSARMFRRGALLALGFMAFVSVLDLLIGPGAILSLVPGATGGFRVAGRAIGWLDHPNLWAAAALPVSVLLAAWCAHTDRLGEFLLVVGLAAVVILSTGSRSALLGLVAGLVVVVVAWLLRVNPRRARAVIWAGVALIIGAATVVAMSSGWRQRTLALFGAGPPVATSKNLFVSSEDLSDPVWWKPVVRVEVEPSARGEDKVHLLDRPGGRWTDRVQQRVRLAPHGQYSLSVEFQPRGASLNELEPAVIGWGQHEGGASEIVVVVGPQGALRQSASGELSMDRVDTVHIEGWTRLEMTFTNLSEASIWLELGIAPQTVDGVGAPAGTLAVRRFQLEEGPVTTAYVGTASPDRRRLQAVSAQETRLRIYQLVLGHALKRPVFGWGANAFVELRNDLQGLAQDMPNHEHSLPLALFLRFGLFGLTALGLTLIAMGGRSLNAWAIVVGVMSANLFDLTVLSSYVHVSTPLFVGLAHALTAWPEGAS